MKRCVTRVVFALAAFLFSTITIAQTNWSHVVDYPVLDHGPEGAWDSGSVFLSHIIKDGDTLKMWYSGRTGGVTEKPRGAGYAWSLDGIIWQRYGQNPLPTLRDNAGPVIKENGLYKMWCVDGDGSAISYASSVDGINWQFHPEPILQRGPAGDWDSDDLLMGAGSVIKKDSLYLMWYHGYKGTSFPNVYVNVGLATSTDGIHWTKYDDPQTTEPPFAASDPVMQVGESGRWDEQHLKGACVLETHHGFELWYSGLDAAFSRQRLGYAISSDGIHWIKYPENPVIHYPPDWGKLGYLPGTVLQMNGLYHMWYATFGALGDYPRIGYATSPVIDHDVAILSSPAHLAYAPIHARGIWPAVTVKNKGRMNESSITVTCEIDSADQTIYSDSQIIEALAGENFAAEEKQMTFKEWHTSDANIYDVRYFTNLEVDDNRGNDTLTTAIVVDTLVENFEAGLMKWSVDTCWNITSKAHSGLLALVSSDAGTYQNDINSAATLGYTFDLSSLERAYLSFWTIYSLMENDYGYVEASVDDGVSWNQLGDPYNGNKLAPWQYETLSLDDYCGPAFSSVKIRFRLQTDATGVSIGWFIDDVALLPESMPVTQTCENLEQPHTYLLAQNYPNPFNPVTTICIAIPRKEFVRLEILDLLGKRVKILNADTLGEGSHTFTWDAVDVPSGVYFCCLRTADFSQTRKMLLVR